MEVILNRSNYFSTQFNTCNLLVLFYYADAKSPQWQVSPKRIGEPDSAIGRTVTQLYAAKRNSVGSNQRFNLVIVQIMTEIGLF
jgi:hypothetical protein